jgi:hypothetical protein
MSWFRAIDPEKMVPQKYLGLAFKPKDWPSS